MADMKKLLKVISEMQVDKSHINNFGNYSYRNAEDILAALKPLMTKHGILPIITDTIEQVGDRYYVKATVKVYDADTSELIAENNAYAREALSKKGMDEAQVTGSSSSYARKYALAGMFNLYPAVDPDEMEPPVEEQQEKPRTEELIEMLARNGVDANDFANLVFRRPFKDLNAKEVNATVMRFNDALNKYMQLDQSRPQGVGA